MRLARQGWAHAERAKKALACSEQCAPHGVQRDGGPAPGQRGAVWERSRQRAYDGKHPRSSGKRHPSRGDTGTEALVGAPAAEALQASVAARRRRIRVFERISRRGARVRRVLRSEVSRRTEVERPS